MRQILFHLIRFVLR